MMMSPRQVGHDIKARPGQRVAKIRTETSAKVELDLEQVHLSVALANTDIIHQGLGTGCGHGKDGGLRGVEGI